MRPIKTMSFILTILFSLSFTLGKTEKQKQPMTFMDIIQIRSLGPRASRGISPDGKWFVYAMSVPDWEKNKSF